jgi:mRNA-degrading endonuclease RelE of RelBE toxin-antitoxin system
MRWNVLFTDLAVEDIKHFPVAERNIIRQALEQLADCYDPTRAFQVCELRFSNPEQPWFRLRVIEGHLKARVLFAVRQERKAVIVTAVLVRDGKTYDIGQVRYEEAVR